MTSAGTAAAAAFASNCKPYNQTWRPKPSPEFIIAAVSPRNPTGTAATTVSARYRSAADGGDRRFGLSVVPRAGAPSSSSSAPETGKDEEENQKKGEEEEVVDGDGNAKQPQSPPPVSMISLEDVNPVGLGRRSRQIFDEVWRKFSGLGQISRTTRTDDETSLLINEGGPMCEFAIPGAQNTTILIVGATSRVGRIVVRKLMLRGYTVKVSALFNDTSF